MARTTVTLDADVETMLRQLMRERGLGFKEALNTALRAGLSADSRRMDVSFPTFDMGESAADLTKALRIAGDLEDVEIVHEMIRGR